MVAKTIMGNGTSASSFTGPSVGGKAHSALRVQHFQKGSEMITFLEDIEKVNSRAEMALRETAAHVYVGIKKQSKLPGGVDKIVFARFVRAQFLIVAEAHGAVARMAARSRSRLLNHGVGIDQSARRVLDMTK